MFNIQKCLHLTLNTQSCFVHNKHVTFYKNTKQEQYRRLLCPRGESPQTPFKKHSI